MNFVGLFVRHYLLAVQFFTRIPITGALAAWVGYSPEMLRASSAHFPGVGVLVGGVGAAVFAGVVYLLPETAFTPLVAAAFSTAITVLITGAFHEDGLADVADGLGGSANRLRAMEIMKDSRVGAFGAITVAMALLTKVSLLAMLGSVDWTLACAGLVAGHAMSRGYALLIMRALPYVGAEMDNAVSKAKPMADAISGRSLLAAGVWLALAVAACTVVLDDVHLLAALAAGTLALLWMWRLFARRLQGFTGDCLGATQQVCEIAFYFGLAVAA
jgi:adenosylcobinamide-GDP ribazoletransferase